MLFPTMCFAFSFESSVMPLHSVSKFRDPNGTRSYKACLYCLLIVLSYYLILMFQSLIYGELNLSSCGENIYSIDLMTLLMAGDKTDQVSNALSILLLICILL